MFIPSAPWGNRGWPWDWGHTSRPNERLALKQKGFPRRRLVTFPPNVSSRRGHHRAYELHDTRLLPVLSRLFSSVWSKFGDSQKENQARALNSLFATSISKTPLPPLRNKWSKKTSGDGEREKVARMGSSLKQGMGMSIKWAGLNHLSVSPWRMARPFPKLS